MGREAADCDSSDSHGYGGHSLGMMSCKGNLGAWEVRRRGTELEPQGPLKVNIAACIWAKSFSSGPGEAFLNAKPSTAPPTPSFTNQGLL